MSINEVFKILSTILLLLDVFCGIWVSLFGNFLLWKVYDFKIVSNQKLYFSSQSF